MVFKRPVQRYGQTPEPVTPYQRAAQEWDERIGTSIVQAKNWRFLAFAAVSTSALLAGGMIWLSAQNRVTPYVVQVGNQGEVKAIGPAEILYNPSDAQIAWFLARFVTNIRSLSIDPVLVRQNWLDAYGFATGRAAAYLNEQAQAHDPFLGVGERSVTVAVTSVVRASPTSFQVKWTEQAFQRGALTDTSHWTAILKVQQTLPRREDVLRKNPLGLYVTELAWTPDYAPPAPTQPSVAATPSLSE